MVLATLGHGEKLEYVNVCMKNKHYTKQTSRLGISLNGGSIRLKITPLAYVKSG